MKTMLLIFLLALSTSFSAEQVIPEGSYSPPVPFFAGRYLQLLKGQFVLTFASDVGRDPTNKPLFEDAERGRYQVDRNRLVLLGDNPRLGEVLFYREIGGVSVLLTSLAVAYDHTEGHPGAGEFLVLKPKDAKDDTTWWPALLKAHPTFAKWAGQ